MNSESTTAPEKREKKRFKLSDLKGFKQMAPYLRPHRAGFTLGIFLISVSSILTLFVTRLWGQLGGVGIMGGEKSSVGNEFEGGVLDGLDLNNLETIGWTIAVVLLIQATMSFFRVYLFANMTEKMMLTLRRDAFEAVVSMPMDFYHNRRVGDLNSRISADITSIQDTFTLTLAELIRQSIMLVGGIAALAYFSVDLTLMMLVTLPVVVLVAIVFGKFIKRLSKETQDEIAASNVIVQEVLTGIVNVKAFANEWFERSRYTTSISSVKDLAMKGAIGRGSFASFIILFIFGAITLVIFKGAALMQSGDLASEHFFTFLLMTGLVAGSVGGLANLFGVVQKGLGAVESLMELLNEEREIKGLDSEIPTLNLRQPLRFENVNFHYKTRKDLTILNNLSLEIRAGEQVALVGPSGAGKSTIASLMLRFETPIDGAILINGKDVATMDLRGYRKRIAYVPQEVILFGDDIRTNIAYGKLDATDEEIRDAAKRAYALEFIENFPDGFATLVGERGIQLSGGQRQRIAIARAILRDPDILILDEATSALDSVSEKEVQAALEELMKDRSTLIIAHRLSTIKNAHRIVVLVEGEVAESGTHAELISNKGPYFRQIQSQDFV
ncbi:MAG TPA: ATP-binding cassette domain-containing protein [Flavobacteriales bacterium]|jgi:ABC-type multidrug transport system fused ATPase/permease subunit|nr:ATP-binding cassette domain-containing protein [Flavobacteriales bacterium]HIB77493.1 ATP-binding cassette domain-containing protein [Flavobacteriales bacterium]HIN42317.1 ATP-binding cassette domain-containing protein [Flavobacteriales bacterium]HIO15440.1 ATP-binding cassette domain-containing protein [Flavobacteriales bacterium]